MPAFIFDKVFTCMAGKNIAQTFAIGLKNKQVMNGNGI